VLLEPLADGRATIDPRAPVLADVADGRNAAAVHAVGRELVLLVVRVRADVGRVRGARRSVAVCMRRGGLLERLLRLAVVSKEDHRSSVRAAGARERDGGERATRSCGRRPLASASSQLVPARAKNSLSHETICCDRTPQQAQPSRSFPRLRLAASTRARCAHEPLARSPLSRSSREAQRSSLQHDDGLLAQIQRGSKRSSVVQPSAARRRARGRRAEGAEVALLDLELVEAGRARAAGRRGRVRTSGERGGRRERGTHRCRARPPCCRSCPT